MDTARRWVVATVLLVAVAGLAGPAGAATTEEVRIREWRYSPDEVTIRPGDKVQWTNNQNVHHTVSADDDSPENFNSGQLGRYDTYTHTFTEPGRFPYYCEIHPGMTGVVVVEAAETTTTTTTTTVPPTTVPPATAPETTTTTAPAPPEPPAPEPPATVPADPEPPATAPTPTTAAEETTTTTTEPPTTTTTEPPTTTTTEATPATTGPPPPVPGEAPGETRQPATVETEAASSPGPEGNFDAALVLLVAALIGAGIFGVWSLWRLHPSRT